MNQISAYIDANTVYGSSESEAKKLRLFQGGRLQTSTINNQDFLPMNFNKTDNNCQIPKGKNRQCFLGGDIRLNEVPDLTVLHAVFLREHNRIADTLAQINPTWPDEIIYQEARRLVIAEIQHIIYNEYLPLILGPKTMQHFDLRASSGYSNSYNPVIDTTILNEFGTAAYRLHTIVQGTLNMYSKNKEVVGQFSIKDWFSNPDMLYEPGAFDMRITGMTGQAIYSCK